MPATGQDRPLRVAAEISGMRPFAPARRVAVALKARRRHQGGDPIDQLHGGEKQRAVPARTGLGELIAQAFGIELAQPAQGERRPVRVVAPWGQYDDSKLVNIGANRWSFKPEVGISKAIGPWTIEGEAAAVIYTENNDFFDGGTLSQAPLYSLQGHLIYGFHSGIWTSLDATYFVGGRTTVNGVLNSDLRQNWRVGATLALPVNRENSIKFYASKGVSARTGDSYDLIGVAWQYRFGGGL